MWVNESVEVLALEDYDYNARYYKKKMIFVH
jgi:hypothetical protein